MSAKDAKYLISQRELILLLGFSWLNLRKRKRVFTPDTVVGVHPPLFIRNVTTLPKIPGFWATGITASKKGQFVINRIKQLGAKIKKNHR